MRNESLLNAEYQYKKDPFSRVFLRYAEELRKAEQYENALAICNQGLVHHPQYVPALICRARILFELGKFEPAESEFKRVLELVPDHFIALKALISLNVKQKKRSEAKQLLEKALFIDPNDQEVVQYQELLKTELKAGINERDVVFLEDADIFAEEMDQLKQDGSELAQQKLEELDLNVPHSIKVETEELDAIDLEFQRALAQSSDSVDELWDDIDLKDEDRKETVTTISNEIELKFSAPGLVSREDQELSITYGLKHEKQEHYEAAMALYKCVWEQNSRNAQAFEHYSRVKNVLQMESVKARKIRFLNNWIEKIKGNYHVS